MKLKTQEDAVGRTGKLPSPRTADSDQLYSSPCSRYAGRTLAELSLRCASVSHAAGKLYRASEARANDFEKQLQQALDQVGTAKAKYAKVAADLEVSSP